MPTTFIQSFGSYICAPTFVMGLVYFGISYVGSELSDPFGHDTNDIHLEAFHRQIEEDLGYYIMQWSLLPALPGTKRLGDRSSTQAKVTTKVRTRRREAAQKGNAFAASVKAAATDAGLESFEDFGAATAAAAAASQARRQRESEIARA